jgi:hypothetical protein
MTGKQAFLASLVASAVGDAIGSHLAPLMKKPVHWQRVLSPLRLFCFPYFLVADQSSQGIGTE